MYRIIVFLSWQLVIGLYYDPCDKSIRIDLPFFSLEISLYRFASGFDFVNNLKKS